MGFVSKGKRNFRRMLMNNIPKKTWCVESYIRLGVYWKPSDNHTEEEKLGLKFKTLEEIGFIWVFINIEEKLKV